MAFKQIPYATEQGICKRVSGNFFRGTGNLIERSSQNQPNLNTRGQKRKRLRILKRRSSNANSLCGQNSAGSLETSRPSAPYISRRQIDDEIEVGRLLDWDVAWLRPVQNLIDIFGGAPEQVREVCSIRHYTKLRKA